MSTVVPQRIPHRTVSDQVARLTAIAADDLVDALGWLGRGWLRPIVRAIGHRAARGFAEEVAEFDRRVGSDGLVAASRALLTRHTRAVAVWGRGNLPVGQPILFVANHPGLTDALALIVAIADDSLILVAADRPFFRETPNVRDSLITVPDDELERLITFRAILRSLANGRSVATFPTGAIEPDPLLHAGAFAAVTGWTRQLAAVRRRAPDLAIVPVAIGGVLTNRALRHPLARVQRSRTQRERAAAMLQVVLRPLRTNEVRVAFGRPLREPNAPSLADAYRSLGVALGTDVGWTTVLDGSNHPATSRWWTTRPRRPSPS
ncbi:MAG: glycerol acyltransferase [Dehalococcoidia bacterium]|nr:MAG: glycerol acyltransferase [Dehalococcoidia bacterium]